MSNHIRIAWVILIVVGASLLAVGYSYAQSGSTFTAKPPAVTVQTARRGPDFDSIRFLSMQRSFRTDLRTQLLSAHIVIRHGRQVASMPQLSVVLDTPEYGL